MPPTVAFKLAFALVLVAAIAASALARAPRRSADPVELRRLVACALALYAVGALATLTHHSGLAGLVYAAGIGVAALAAWLSRGRDQEDPPDGGTEPVDEEPPPRPDGMPWWDWERFERDFRDYAGRAGSGDSVDGHPLNR
ncbi:MAG TPA: hypothetical protein VHV28_09435 [Solirubrobacteraceae bacterium]|nr:hypothetical protein [Solirubrobacteraceae bacterium]